MLKRFQILLEDWQEEYLRFISETYDVSFSESTRITLCVGMIESAKQVCPGFKPGISVKEAAQTIAKIEKGKAREEKFHSLLSKMYFEARKAVEVRLALAKTQANKGKKQ